MTTTATPQLLKNAEAAELLGIKPGTLAIWRLNGKSPKFKKIGKLVRYDKSDLLAWLESNTRTSTSHQGLQAY